MYFGKRTFQYQPFSLTFHYYLSTSVSETLTVTRIEHFACQDRIVPQIFILLISYGEKILSNGNVVV